MNRLIVLVAFLGCFLPRLVHADAGDAACVADHRTVQTQRQTGHLLEARDAASRCANAACPQLVRQDCASWYVDLESSVPSLVFEVRDERGNDLVDAQVFANGVPIEHATHGRAVSIDPGHYRMRFEARSHQALELELVVREGVRNRAVAVMLARIEAQTSSLQVSSKRIREFSPAVIALGSVAVAGLVTFGALGITGMVKMHELSQDHCKPDCSRSEVERANHLYIGADVAAGVALAAAVAGAVVYFRGRREITPQLSLDARPVRGGGAFGVRGAF